LVLCLATSSTVHSLSPATASADTEFILLYAEKMEEETLEKCHPAKTGRFVVLARKLSVVAKVRAASDLGTQREEEHRRCSQTIRNRCSS
jgi:hypothetical protein